MRNGKGHIDMELINLENVMQTLQEYAQEVRNLYQDNLIKKDKIASGDLLNSVEYQIIRNGQTYLVQLRLADYWKYVERGVRGKENPGSPYDNPGWKAYPFILKWIDVKPVLPRPLENGDLPTQRQLAAMITHSIEEKGIKATNALGDAIQEVNQRYKDKLVIALHKDMEVLMKVLVGTIQGSVPMA